ncbi:MAG: hypothetical protein GYA02_13410 [Clostridiaceae bacterium]|nr:hypothetical protein [Clostridiaceae bacterium]
MRKELVIGLFIQSMYLIANCFLSIPYFLSGLFQGLAICFIIVGMLPEEFNTKLKKWKISMVK